jgi:purine-binding chemotaxis protein CheW
MTFETASVSPVQQKQVTSAVEQIQSGQAAYLIGRAGSQLHAIPVGNVIEIMRVLPVEPVAGAPAYVRGLCIIHGAPVPVVDPGLLIGHRQTQPGRLVAIRAGERTVALQLDAVLGVRIVDAGTFDALPPLLRDVAAETVAAIGTADNELLLALRATRIVPDDVLNDLARIGDRS